MRKIPFVTLLILAAALSVAAQKPRAKKSRAQKAVAQAPLAQAPIVQAPVAQEPVTQAPLAQEPVVQDTIAQESALQNPLVQAPLVQAPLVRMPLVQWPLMQRPFVQNPFAQNNADDPFGSVSQPLTTVTPAVDESPATQFSPDLEAGTDLTGLATYADAQARNHTNLVTIDVVYLYRSYVMPGNPGDAFLGNVINVQGPGGPLRLWMPFSANAGYWVGFICNMEGYARYRNLRMTYDADSGIVTALDYR